MATKLTDTILRNEIPRTTIRKVEKVEGSIPETHSVVGKFKT